MSTRKDLRQNLLIAVFIVIVLVAYGRFMFPAPFSIGDWTYPIPAKITTALGWPHLFQTFNLNNYLGLSLHGSPITAIFTLLVAAGFPSVWLTAIVYLWMPIILLATGVSLLGHKLNWSIKARLLSAIVFMINSYVIILLSGGQINGIIAYSAIPFVVLYLDKLLKKPSFEFAVILNFWLLLISLVEPRYHLLLFLVAIWWVIARWKEYTFSRTHFKTLGFALVLFFALNAYWIYGTFAVAGTALAPADYTSPNWLVALSYSTVWHALLLHHVWWPQSGHISSPFWLFSILPVVSIFALFGKQRRLAWSLLGLLLTGILLAKGVNPPFGEVYRWLFLYFPGFSGFRDPAKFFTLIGFAYALLVPLGLITVWQIRSPRFRRLLQVVLVAWLGASFLLGYKPLWQQKVAGTFQKDQVVADAPVTWFANQPDINDWYRTFWFPKSHRYYTYDPAHPSIEAMDEPVRTVRNRLPGIDHWLNKLQGKSYLPYLLSAYGVRYVAVPGDTANELFTSTFPLTQDDVVTAWQQAAALDQPATIFDQLGKTTHVAHYSAALPEGFAARELVVTNSPNHPAFADRVSTDPTQTGLVWLNDQASEAANKTIYQHAKDILIQSDFDAAALDGGALQWTIQLPVTGQYRLSLPHSDFTYQLDQQPLVFADQQTIDNQRYSRTAPLTLEQGVHILSLDLTNGSAPSIIPSLTAKDGWQACKSSEMGHLRGLDDISNAEALRSQPFTALDNVVNDTRCISYQLPNIIDLTNAQLLVRWKGEVTGTTPYLQLNFAPISGATVDFTELKTGSKLLAAPTINYDLAQISIVLPAGEQSKLATNELSIAVVSHGAVPITAAILEPVEASTSSTLPTITTQTIDDTKKIVTVDSHDMGIWLTISNEFHSGWQLFESPSREPVTGHFATLLKQNGWYLPSSDTEQTYELLFTPTAGVKTTSYFSLVSLIGVIYLLVKKGKKR